MTREFGDIDAISETVKHEIKRRLLGMLNGK